MDPDDTSEFEDDTLTVQELDELDRWVFDAWDQGDQEQ